MTASSLPSTLEPDLRNHLALCEELLELLGRENLDLRDPEQPSQFTVCQGRKRLLPRLEASLASLRRHREEWRALPAAERARRPETAALIRRNQEALMRALMLDRENEQFLLRRGLVPARHLPPASRQQPHFVADLYRRTGLASG